MSARESERVEVMRRVEKGALTVRAAAAVLAVSYRQAKRIWRRYQTGGAAAVVHRHVGRASIVVGPPTSGRACSRWCGRNTAAIGSRGSARR